MEIGKGRKSAEGEVGIDQSRRLKENLVTVSALGQNAFERGAQKIYSIFMNVMSHPPKAALFDRGSDA